MGCGKSSVGRKLSQLLCCPFMDLDQVIEERAGRTIPEIFSQNGEPAFRQIELEALQYVVSDTDHEQPTGSMVLALGGGAVMTAECAEIIRTDTKCIYLRASVDTLMEHLEGQTDNRPLLSYADLRNRITELMAIRSATYENTAHTIIDIDGKSIEALASEIISRLG